MVLLTCRLSDNNIGDEGAIAIALAIKSMTTCSLRELQ